MSEGACAIWGTKADILKNGGPWEYHSPRAGGKYCIGTRHIEEIGRQSVDFKIKLSSWIVEQSISGVQVPEISAYREFLEFIENRKNINFTNKVDRFLKYCYRFKNKVGATIFERNASGLLAAAHTDSPMDDVLYAYIEARSYIDAGDFSNVLETMGYLGQSYTPSYGLLMELDKIDAVNSSSTQVFVAMWFDSSLIESYENAIEPAIREAGYEPRIIRKVEHNNKIDDEIIAEIRRSKFVIADFTCGFSKDGLEAIARGGVYYEAGFAQGLGLPVIWTCHESIINHVHFDTRQYNHIVWKDAADLKEKLLNRIRATII